MSPIVSYLLVLLAPIGDTPNKDNDFVHSTRVVHLTETKALCNNEGDAPDKEYEVVQQMRITSNISKPAESPTHKRGQITADCMHT